MAERTKREYGTNIAANDEGAEEKAEKEAAEKRKAAWLRKPMTVGLLALLSCFLWGSAIPAIKIGYELLGIDAAATGSQIVFAGYRFALAGLMAILIGSLGNRKFLFPQRNEWFKVVKLSIFQTILQYLFFYIGLSNTTGVKGAILVATNVFFSILVTSLVFRQEKLTARKIAGCVFGFAGVVIINLSGDLDMSFRWNGEGFVLLASVAYAFSSSLIKNYSRTSDPVMLSGYQFTFGGLVMILWGLASGGRVGNFTSASLLVLIYLALISAVAYTLWSVLLKYNPVSRVSVYGFMNPVFGVCLSGVILGEDQAFSFRAVLALLLVCVGIAVVNRTPAKSRQINP